MQILLLKRIGKLSQGIHTVRDGYGRYLITSGQAYSCSPENINLFKETAETRKKEAEVFENKITELCKSLENKFIFIVSPVNETGSLYGSIKPKQVVVEIKKQLINDDLISNQYIIINNITRPGVFTAILNFSRENNVKINVVVGSNENIVKEMYLNHINTEKNEKKEVKEEKTYNQKKVLNIHKDEDNSEKNNTTKNTDESVETAE